MGKNSNFLFSQFSVKLANGDRTRHGVNSDIIKIKPLQTSARETRPRSLHSPLDPGEASQDFRRPPSERRPAWKRNERERRRNALRRVAPRPCNDPQTLASDAERQQRAKVGYKPNRRNL